MRIVSGIQPTSQLHIGNYLGAIKQWIPLQEKNECVFFIADLHALTVPYDPKKIQNSIKETVVAYIAAGLNPEKAIIFVQSQVKEHINAGLLDYPVLQAADVLIYKGEGVPVGKDQEQHIELMRSLAKKFNQKFGQTFKEPASLILKEGSKIMSLQDPKRKMSKSDEPKSCIFLFDSPEDIQKKVSSAQTDSGKDIIYNIT